MAVSLAVMTWLLESLPSSMASSTRRQVMILVTLAG